jgi:tape measure domain-containing protein
MPNEELSVLISADIAQFEANMAKVESDLGRIGPAASAASREFGSSLGSIGDYAKSVGGALTTYITLPLGLLAGASISAAGDIQALEKGFAATYKGSEDLSVALGKVRELAKLPGLGLKEALQGATNLQAAGFSADLATRALGAFGNALATVGKGKADLDGVGLALGQIASKGKISAEEINQLAERVPQIRTAMQAAFGTADTEALQKAKISATDFVEGVTAELAKLPKVTGGLNNVGENIGDSFQKGFAKIGLAANSLFGLEELGQRLGDTIDSLTDSFTSLDPSTQKLILGLGAAAFATGPLLLGLGGLVSFVPKVVEGLELIEAATALSLGPLALIGVTIGAAAALAIANWDSIVSYFKGPNGAVFSDLASAVGDGISAIVGAFRSLANGPIGTLIGQFARLELAVASKGIQAGFAVISSALSIFAGDIRIVTDLLSGNLDKALTDAEQAARNASQPFKDLFGLSKNNTASFSEFFEGVLPAAQAAGEGVDYFSDEITKAGAQVGLLQALKNELKELQDQRDRESSTTAINADTARIKSLQQQIAVLEGTEKASKKAQDALAKLRQELAQLGALDNILGNTPSQVEVLERRSDALAKGLRTLVDAGVNPSSKAFQGYATELVNVGQALDKLKSQGGALDLKPVNIKSLIPQTLGDTLPQDVARLLGDYANKPIELPLHLEIKPIANGLTDFKKNLDGELLNIGAGFREAAANAALFGGSFDEAGAKAAVLGQSIQSLIASGTNPYSQELQNLAAQQRALVAESLNTQLNIQTLKDGFAGLAEAVGQSLGNIAFGGGSAADALKSAFASLVGVLADYASKKGKLLIADGIADLLIPGSQAIGALKIAAGTGLIVAAGVARAGAGAITSGGGGGGGGGGGLASSPPSAGSNRQPTAPAPITNTTIEHRVVMVAQGSSLVGVLDIEKNKRVRINGSGGH